MLLAYIGLKMPGLVLEHRAQLLLSQLQHFELSEPVTGNEEAWTEGSESS